MGRRRPLTAGGHTIEHRSGGPSSGSLTADERALLFYYCLNHTVARCLSCARSFYLSELVADLLSGRTHLCPQCRRDLTDNVRSHVYGCGVLPAEVRKKAEALRDMAHRLVKESRGLRDRSEVLITAAEAAIEEGRRALWKALKATRPST